MGPFVLESGAVGQVLPRMAIWLILAGVSGFGLQRPIVIVFALTALLTIGLADRIRQPPLLGVSRKTMSCAGQFPIRLAMLFVIALVLFGQILGLALGALVTGAVLRALFPQDLHDDLMASISAVGYDFLSPFFLSPRE